MLRAWQRTRHLCYLGRLSAAVPEEGGHSAVVGRRAGRLEATVGHAQEYVPVVVVQLCLVCGTLRRAEVGGQLERREKRRQHVCR